MSNYITNVYSVAQCAALCTKRYIGLQANGQCFCSDVYNRAAEYYKVADTECGGQIGSSLGGSWSNAVFYFCL